MIVKKLAIDLGTSHTLIAVPGKGIIINEPSVVAISSDTEKIVAVGKSAEEMLGRTPESIIAVNPIRDGVIASYKFTEGMLRYFFDKITGFFSFIRPEVMISVSANITSTERRAVIDAALSAGAKKAYVIKAPVAAALGANIPIGTPSGHMILDIGAGTTEVAVISLGDIVVAETLRIGGEEMDEAILDYVRKKYKIIIGSKTAERAKIKIGSALPSTKEKRMEVSGSNAITNLPETLIINSNDIASACEDIWQQVIQIIKSVFQKTPPELAADVIDKGIIITGGGSKMRRADELLSKITGIPCQIAEQPNLCTVKGALLALEHLDDFKERVLWIK